VKIVYIHQYFKTPREAGGTRSYEMARRLVAHGHEVEMITTKSSGKAFKKWLESEVAGIHVHRLYVPYNNSMTFIRRLIAFFKFAVKSARKAASFKHADIVFASSTPLTVAIPAVYASRKRRIPLVFEIRDLWPELPIAIGALKNRLVIFAAKKLEKFAYSNSSQIVALSPGMKHGIAKTGYSPERIHVIPNSCDVDLFSFPRDKTSAFRSRFSWLKKRPLVVYAGTIGKINGVDFLARIAKAMLNMNANVRFLVVGEGAEYNKVKEVAYSLGILEKNFFMIPAIPKSEMPMVLSAADIATSLFIDLPEMWNNSANKFFDALASGTPVVVNYRGWQAELIEKHSAGLVVDGKDEKMGARLIARLLADPEQLERAGVAAHRLANECFDRDKMANNLEQVFLDVVDKKRNMRCR